MGIIRKYPTPENWSIKCLNCNTENDYLRKDDRIICQECGERGELNFETDSEENLITVRGRFYIEEGET